jgi:hypothetical protein
VKVVTKKIKELALVLYGDGKQRRSLVNYALEMPSKHLQAALYSWLVTPAD